MGIVVLSHKEENFKNCINLDKAEGIIEKREQYGSHGNIIYYYKFLRESLTGLKLIINADNREIDFSKKTRLSLKL